MGKHAIVPVKRIENLILVIRGQRVMLDADLAMLYGVETKRLNRQVKRNLVRFPEDFLFQLTPEEAHNLRRQIGTSSSGYGGRRYLPYAFTEHGAIMAATILNSSARSRPAFTLSAPLSAGAKYWQPIRNSRPRSRNWSGN